MLYSGVVKSIINRCSNTSLCWTCSQPMWYRPHLCKCWWFMLIRNHWCKLSLCMPIIHQYPKPGGHVTAYFYFAGPRINSCNIDIDVQ